MKKLWLLIEKAVIVSITLCICIIVITLYITFVKESQAKSYTSFLDKTKPIFKVIKVIEEEKQVTEKKDNSEKFNVEKWARKAGIDKVIKKVHKRHGRLIKMIAKRHNIRWYYPAAKIVIESGGNVFAVGRNGEIGLMQLKKGTAREVAKKFKVTVKNYFQRYDNVFLGTGYFKLLLIQFHGDIDIAVAAYNDGPGKVKEKIKKGADLRTKIYVLKFNYVVEKIKAISTS